MSGLDQAIRLRPDLQIPPTTKEEVISFAYNVIDNLLHDYGDLLPEQARDRLFDSRETILQFGSVLPVDYSQQKLQCPICGAAESFTLDPEDGSRGYCSTEKRVWEIQPFAE